MKLNLKLVRGLVAAVLISAATGIPSLGCNTTEGAGKDVEAGGRALKHAAQDAKD